MTYKVNSVELTLQPTSGKWLPRTELGRNGYGHPVYPAVREFEIRWLIHTPAEANQIQTFYNAVSNTGTVVVDLPQYAAATYTFFSYTGCILQEPQFGTFFTENIQDVTIIVSNIRT
jgi:hypothetical protein